MHLHGLPLVFVLLALLALVLAGTTLLGARLTHPRPKGPFAPSFSLPPPPGAGLAQGFALPPEAPEGAERVLPLMDPLDALALRLDLIEAAQSSVDLQYYIWHDDTAGALMLAALRAAAGRGVRVRLLIDDNGSAGMDEPLSALAALPGVEVRLFNPFPMRRARVLAYLADFRRLNRRMHNKAMVVDGTVALLGGRNIGDEYFNQLSPGGLYMDLDVAIAGPVVPEVAAQFDLYWNTPLSVPLAELVPPLTPVRLAHQAAQEAARLSRPEAVEYVQALQNLRGTAFALQGRSLASRASLVFDPPEKVIGLIESHRMLWRRLIRVLGKPKSELILISPYLVPTRSGVKALGRFAGMGVKVRLFTNSFAANDVPLVHSGYAHRRRPLLRKGVEIWEYAPDAETRRPPSDFFKARLRGLAPFSRNKLHAKVFVVDASRLFIGSFNFDPRSMRLNTELGLVLDAPELAGAISRSFESFVPERAWQVQLAGERRLQWSRPGEPPRDTEPGTGAGSRFLLALAQRLPIEWML